MSNFKKDMTAILDNKAVKFTKWIEYCQRMSNRFGNTKKGDKRVWICNTVFKVNGNRPTKDTWIDSYGEGCVSNDVRNPYRVKLMRAGRWNRPIPKAADPYKIEAAFKRYNKECFKNRPYATRPVDIKMGLKSEPFPWMDLKNKIALSILESAAMQGVRLEIHTRSDLLAHDDYLEVLKLYSHKVIIHLGSDDNTIERVLSPGSASPLRRRKAYQKLKEHGVDVKLLVDTSKAESKKLLEGVK